MRTLGECLTEAHSPISTFSFVTVQLLDFEARSGEQVPLLLKMKRSHLALGKAVESGDTDLGECPAPAPICRLGQMTIREKGIRLPPAENDLRAVATYGCVNLKMWDSLTLFHFVNVFCCLLILFDIVQCPFVVVVFWLIVLNVIIWLNEMWME